MRKNKKGSVTVFLMIFFSGMLIAISAFVMAAGDKAVSASSDSLVNLYAGNLRAEYDINLFERYGVLGFYSEPVHVKDRLKTYSKASFKGKKYAKLEDWGVNTAQYSLDNLDVFRKQIISAGKPGVFKPKVVKGAEQTSRPAKIRNGAIKGALPSRGKARGGVASGSCLDFLKDHRSEDVNDSLLRKGSEKYFIYNYMDKAFRNFHNDKNLGKTFFQGEMEYILFGSFSDKSNELKMKTAFIFLREGLNMIYLFEHREAEILAFSAISKIPEGVIRAAWAFAESVNDYQLIADGKKVPLWKTEDEWAISLKSIFSSSKERSEEQLEKIEEKVDKRHEGMSAGNDGNRGYIDPGNKRGPDYEGYIKMFLTFVSDKTKILRMMDLVQINMKYIYNGDFLLQDYSEGSSVFIKVNGKYHFADDRF